VDDVRYAVANDQVDGLGLLDATSPVSSQKVEPGTDNIATKQSQSDAWHYVQGNDSASSGSPHASNNACRHASVDDQSPDRAPISFPDGSRNRFQRLEDDGALATSTLRGRRTPRAAGTGLGRNAGH